MYRFTVICFLWMFLQVAHGTEQGKRTKNVLSIPDLLQKANNLYNNNKVSTEHVKKPQSQQIIEDLKQYLSEKERQTNTPEVQLADDKETGETLENVLVKRLLMGREINSALDRWLVAKIKQVDAKEKETAKKGWGNHGMPPLTNP